MHEHFGEASKFSLDILNVFYRFLCLEGGSWVLKNIIILNIFFSWVIYYIPNIEPINQLDINFASWRCKKAILNMWRELFSVSLPLYSNEYSYYWKCSNINWKSTCCSAEEIIRPIEDILSLDYEVVEDRNVELVIV